MTSHQHTPGGWTEPSEVVIPAPRGPAEPRRRAMLTEGAPRSVRHQPGWVSLVEALDHTVAAMVAGLEHRLCCADAVTAAKLRHRLDQARRLALAWHPQ